MDTIIVNACKQLEENSDEKTRISGKRFFKEEVKTHGVKTAVVGKIGGEIYKTIENKNKKYVFGLCEELWKTGYMEENFIACDWAYRMRKEYTPGDMAIFERWINDYVSNWATCDTLCNHAVGTCVTMYPDNLKYPKVWAKSKNRWMRRAAAVTLIIPAREGKFIEDIFEIADTLLTDGDDMVQKGYGWMLKAASQAHLPEVWEYVMKHKTVMPRTALRYAIEKMPKDYKEKAMKK